MKNNESEIEKVDTSAKQQESTKKMMSPDAAGTYYHVDENPVYPGGFDKIDPYLAENLKYPQEARSKGVHGRVTVTFIIEKDGSINDVTVLRGIGSGCDEEAMRVVKAMPKWKPGKQNGQPVRVHFTLPNMFKID